MGQVLTIADAPGFASFYWLVPKWLVAVSVFVFGMAVLCPLSDSSSSADYRCDCHNRQISEAISAYRSTGPAFPSSNQRTNSSWTTWSTSVADSQFRSRGKIVPVSGSYSSVFSLSNATPIGSCRKRSADTESNNCPYSAFNFRRSCKISSRVLGIIVNESVPTSWPPAVARAWATAS